MNKKVKKVIGYGLVSLMLCGPVLVSKVSAEESGSIQTTAQFKNHKDGSQSIVGKTMPNTKLRIGYDGTIETVSDGEGNYELKIPEEKNILAMGQLIFIKLKMMVQALSRLVLKQILKHHNYIIQM